MSRESDYWAERWVQLEDSNHRRAEETMTVIDGAYRQAEREVEQQLSTWYQRFADNNGIVDMAEARRLLNSGELAEFKWTVEQYIQHGRENGVSADWSKELENASARFHVTRLEALRLNIQQSAEVLFGNQLDQMDDLMRQTYMGSYYHTAFTIQTGVGVGWNVAMLNQGAVQVAVNRPWSFDGRNFSDRIWANRTALINDLQRNLTQSLMMENTCDKTIEALMNRFGVSRNQAARLVHTENAYIHSVAQGDSYRANGVRKVIFVATLDDRTSDICRDMDGTIIDMKDYAPGQTVPPLHPWCRSVTAPYSDLLAGIGERAARDPETGKTYFVPRDMTYKDWQNTFVNGGPKTGLTPTTAYPFNHSCELAAKFGTAYYDELHRRVGQCTNPDLQRVWAAHESEVRVGDAKYRGHEYCSGDTIYVNGPRDAKGTSWQAPYQVTFHESGHALDSIVSGQTPGFTRHFSGRYQNGLFPKTIKDEVGAMVSAKDADLKAQWKAHEGDWDWLHKNGFISDGNYQFFQQYGRWIGGEPKYSKSMAYKAIEREIMALSPLQKADLSDIIEGATGAKIQAGFGHGKSYWTKRTIGGIADGLATEAFAEMVDSEMSNPDSLAILKQWLPKSYGVFCDMLKAIK